MDQEELLDENTPSVEDSLRGLNEKSPILIHSLARNRFFTYMKNLHLKYHNLLTMNQSQVAQLKAENQMIHNQLRLHLEHQMQLELEETLGKNNELLQFLYDLQNQFINDLRYLDWLELELKNEDKMTPPEETLKEEPKNTLEEEAQKARMYPYPHPTPLHFTPFLKSPFGY